MTWFASRWRNHQPKRAEKPHSKSACRKMPDGPATRPKTPLAVENGVGKPAAPEKGAPNAGSGKRDWRTPIPHLSLLDRKVRQGLIVFIFRARCRSPPRSRKHEKIEDEHENEGRGRVSAKACSLAKRAGVLSNLVCSISKLSIVRPVFPASACIAATG